MNRRVLEVSRWRLCSVFDYGVPGTVRASFAVYNTRQEVDAFIAALQRILPMLG
ncbi:MAG: hypothetical protein IKU16_00530 [Muribaculaceae bacterium]|nr:hypothetical protein [Muribaculaceae bacterium]